MGDMDKAGTETELTSIQNTKEPESPSHLRQLFVSGM